MLKTLFAAAMATCLSFASIHAQGQTISVKPGDFPQILQETFKRIERDRGTPIQKGELDLIVHTQQFSTTLKKVIYERCQQQRHNAKSNDPNAIDMACERD